MSTALTETTNKFVQQRNLSHELVSIFQKCAGEKWLDELSVFVGKQGNEQEIREYLIRQEPHQLQLWIDGATIEYDYKKEDINEWVNN